MSNLRIVYDNAADRATVTASSTAGVLAAANLLTDTKSDVWRATDTSARLTLSWSAGEAIACIALPFCNLSPSATIRAQLYSDAAGTVLVYDSGAVLACPAPALRPRGWTAAQAASAYAYGGGASARLWLPSPVQAMSMTIDIADPGNLQGYIEAARLVAGPYWSPMYNASNASMTVVDTAELYRTDAGDQGASAGYQYRRVPISLSAMPAADRAAFVNIVRNSRAAPILLSVFPGSADLALERDHMVYGRRSKDSDVAIKYAACYSTDVEIEEI